MKLVRLQIYEHGCTDLERCGGKVIERDEGKPRIGVVRKLLLGEAGKHGRFVPNVEMAIEFAARRGWTISQEDIDACREAMR